MRKYHCDKLWNLYLYREKYVDKWSFSKICSIDFSLVPLSILSLSTFLVRLFYRFSVDLFYFCICFRFEEVVVVSAQDAVPDKWVRILRMICIHLKGRLKAFSGLFGLLESILGYVLDRQRAFRLDLDFAHAQENRDRPHIHTRRKAFLLFKPQSLFTLLVHVVQISSFPLHNQNDEMSRLCQSYVKQAKLPWGLTYKLAYCTQYQLV